MEPNEKQWNCSKINQSRKVKNNENIPNCKTNKKNNQHEQW